jgi:DNA-directed RNA polymerase specialized sigma24 family protein
MESAEEIRKQLNGLVQGIRECNFIPWDQRENIVQDTWVKIIQKMNEGVIVDDYDQIKGYTFQILRNNCLAYQRDKEKKRTYELRWDMAEDNDTDKEEYQKELKSIVEKKIQSVKYNDVQKKLIMLALTNVDRSEAEIELGLTKEQYKRMRQGIVLQLKGDMRRKVKYIIKHKDKEWIQIPCYTSTDVKQFLNHHTKRQVSSIIYNGLMSTDGYYVEIINKIKQNKKIPTDK